MLEGIDGKTAARTPLEVADWLRDAEVSDDFVTFSNSCELHFSIHVVLHCSIGRDGFEKLG